MEGEAGAVCELRGAGLERPGRTVVRIAPLGVFSDGAPFLWR